MDNGHRVVARIPFRLAGPRRLVTNSEVATMAYGIQLLLHSGIINLIRFPSTCEFENPRTESPGLERRRN